MNENKMGYHGSKSALCGSFAVKEQLGQMTYYQETMNLAHRL
jgi:hypothetical protein